MVLSRPLYPSGRRASSIENDQHSRDPGLCAMASWMIVLLMPTAPMPPHNIDTTGILGAMMFSTRGSSSSQIYCKQKKGEAKPPSNAYRDIAVLTVAVDIRL
jgi:hypothetical protein